MAKDDRSSITILDIIKAVLPDGTIRDTTDWDQVCDWPPDLFAAVATITERSGLYSERIFTAYWDKEQSKLTKWIKQIRKAGEEWSRQATPPQLVQELWSELIKRHRKARIDDASDVSLSWKSIIFRLLAIADQASVGVGFPPPVSDRA